MSRLLWLISPLVVCSGLCGLVDQVVWTRELRLIFGASTAASSAVIAIFIAGLGFGGLYFGKRAEQSARPLVLYARLELAVGVLSALTPLSLDAARTLYTWSGGSPALGHVFSNVLRLLLAAAVLLPPTFAMGGTLPALARTLEGEADRSRRAVGLIYALNTLGAVAGAALTTFVWLERLGNRTSLYSACALNVLVGGLAYACASMRASAPPTAAEDVAPSALSAAAPAWFVYCSAAVVGFAFFLMELVWYRVFGPLLGGSVFTFGLILAVALAGIGLGSALYAACRLSRAHLLGAFAATCAAEALCLAAPFALGDRLAVGSLLLQPLAAFGFTGMVLGWVAIALCAVFPAAVVSGFQFPLLIALLGAGRAHVARDLGNAYAANTLGAIAGALAGGFGLLPLLGALGAWRGIGYLLAGWSVLALGVALVRARAFGAAALSGGMALLSVLLMAAEGPTAAFRHSQIGVGRVPLDHVDTPNSITAWRMQERRAVDWQSEGIESAVAITHYDGVAFVVNGKSDGSAVTDAPTQVMGGLLGAALVPRVKRALVIGLGTGSTAGWLASLPEIEQVDVAEIEPEIVHVARRCAAVNRHALDNPKLRVVRGDARELLAVLRNDYDVIFSEPSNPYRAGVASMYAREFYSAVHKRLRPEGVFVQWLQAYDVDASSVRTVYATLAAVFPHIATWNGLKEDLLLVASQRELAVDVPALRARIAAEPFASALRVAWYAEDAEGFLAHFVAAESFARAAADGGAAINTDDLSPVEFGFARSLRGRAQFTSTELISAAIESGAERPVLRGAEVDWSRVDYLREAFALIVGSPTSPERLTPEYRNRLTILSKWANGDIAGAFALWSVLGPRGDPASWPLMERIVRAELLAYEGSIESERTIGELLHDRPTEAVFMRAVYAMRHGQRKAGTALLREALVRYRGDPWPHPLPIARALNGLQIEAPGDRELAPLWLDALARPFALRVNETARERAQLRLALALGPEHPACVRVFEGFEPYPPWLESMLQLRADCYDKQKHALRERAQDDLAAFRAHAPVSFEQLLSR